MNNSTHLLDTSAVLTLIEDEAGADRVESLLVSKAAALAWPVLMELFYITRRERGAVVADQRYAMMKRAAEVIWDLDEPVLLTAARLKADHPVSLSDALIAAYALRHDLILLHKDPEYETLAGEVRLEALPYKPTQ